MTTAAIKGYNFAPAMYLLELSTQCQLAKECDRRLHDAAPAWYANATSAQFANAVSPRDIILTCTAFLSAVGVISKLLFAGRRRDKRIVRRCASLRELLKVKDGDLPILRNLGVRNGFEHVDERLDEVLPSFREGGFSTLSVHEKEPDAKVILKRFDPRKLTISFADEKISLVDCMSEILKVEIEINPACRRLHGPQFQLWA